MARAALVLASASPRRRSLLAAAGIDCAVLDPGEDGPSAAREPAARVLDHARYKAARGAELAPECRVLAADTLVWLGEHALPKPRDRSHAEHMIRRLSGRDHQVWTGVVLRTPQGREFESADVATVRFRALQDAEIQAYLAGEEWRDKAGAYGIQGAAGAWAELLEGDLETVIGLSTATVRRLLAQADACSERPGG